MKLLSKSGDTVELLTGPGEELLHRGDYLQVIDGDKRLLLQVIDVEYAELPGALEDALRGLGSEEFSVKLIDPYGVGSLLALLKDARLIVAKVRGVVDGEGLRNDLLWLPSKLNSKIERASPDLISELSRVGGRRPIVLGECMGGLMAVSAEALDGRLTIITGKKETGKSHLAKLLITALAEYGARVIALDVNGEYIGLSDRIDGVRSAIADKHLVLTPGENFRVSVEDTGLRTMLDILQHVLDTPAASMREFARLWRVVEKIEGKVTMRGLIDAASRTQMHESVREALLSRLMSLNSTGFFNDESPTNLEQTINSLTDGGILVVNLSQSLPHGRRIVVEYLLSKLSTLLKQGRIDPIFLLAEEAHLYLRETYWDDLVTRMRHIGLFPIFVTNQPDMIPETVYRQADNIFLFNFTNESDLEYIAKASRIDSETAKRVAKALPQRYCLVIGRVVNDLPLVVRVREIPFRTLGETRLFFKERAL